MLYKSYGKTGKKISAISFGGMRFPDDEDHQANAKLVHYAHSKGINYFDTAPGYCGDNSELIMGEAFKDMDRDTFYVSTKSNKPDGGELRANLETSLERMGVEKIDFFHIWYVLSLEAWKERIEGGAVAAAVKAKEEGLIEHLVVSSHMLSEELKVMLADGPFEGVTLGYCAINFPFRDEAVKAAGDMGIGVVTMNPLGGGTIPIHAEHFDFIRGPKDATVVEAALRFNVSNPAITSALVGFSNEQQVDEAIAAIEDFQPYDQAHIDSMRKKILDSFDGLCTGCSYCLPCPEGVEIPKMMDAYNSRVLVDDKPRRILNRLKWHWSMPSDNAGLCSQCGACEARCTQHLPIIKRLEEIAALPKED